MTGEENKFLCSRCRHTFEFVPEPTDIDECVKITVKCPACGTGYVKKVTSFPKGYANKPHS